METKEQVKAQAKKLLKLFGPAGKHWCKDAMARNKNGYEVAETSRTATQWCLLGGINKLHLDAL